MPETRSSILDSATARAIDYSIVIPVYYNEGDVRPTFEAIQGEVIAKHSNLHCEVIFVDDGSADGSLQELLSLHQENSTVVKVIKLTRNFGQPSARLAGLSYAKGKAVVSMSADGQDPVHLINEMLAAHLGDGYQIVICNRRGRDESWYRVVTSRIFYSLMRGLSFSNMPKEGFDFVLLGRQALEVILASQDAQSFFQGQVLWSGFKPKFIEYRRRHRKVGKSRWTFGKKISLLIDGVLNYSFLPIRLMSLTGMICSLLGLLGGFSLAVRKMFFGAMLEGWTTLVVLISVLGGIQMLMLGVIGEYVWRCLAEARNRAPYVVEMIYDKERPEWGPWESKKQVVED